jgi:hypothetical protein
LFELLGIAPGKVQLLAQGSSQVQNGVIQDLRVAVEGLLQRLVKAQQKLQGGLPVWNRRLLEGAAQAGYRAKLDGLKTFLESLQAYSSPGLLKNFRYDEIEVKNQQPRLAAIDEINQLDGLVSELVPLAAYLAQAEMLITPGHPLVPAIKAARTIVLNDLENEDRRSAPGFRQQAVQKLAALKKEYAEAYIALHVRSRLGVSEAKRWQALKADRRLRTLEWLSAIQLLPRHQLQAFKDELAKLRECTALTEQVLQVELICPHCQFRPVDDTINATAALDQLEEKLDGLLQAWKNTLLENLDSESVKRDLELLPAGRRRLVNEFVQSRQLPEEMGQDFIQAVQEVLSGLERVALIGSKLLEALQHGGLPATPSEIRRRFNEYIDKLLVGKDERKIRLALLEKAEQEGAKE